MAAAGTTPQSWAYHPDYLLITKDAQGKYHRFDSMVSVQAQLVTAAGVSQMVVLLADPDNALYELSDIQGRPHPMQAIGLLINNRWGQWGWAWQGYIDSVHKVSDPGQGEMLQIVCSGPMKKWEITTTTSTDALDLAIAYLRNVSGASMLQFSAARVGYPLNKIYIDTVADGGSGIQTGLITQAEMDPQAQTWSAIMQQYLSNTAMEWFFDERGDCIYRRAGYLLPPPRGQYRTILEEDIIHADLSESDQGVVTSVTVRFSPGVGASYNQQNQVVAKATPSMAQHLGQRNVVIYAPWIIGNAPYAQFLANNLLQQYAGNVLGGTLTIAADPMVTIGSIIDAPALLNDTTKRTLYYISAISYQLEWNGQWTMTLTLLYGRAPGQSFPYGESAVYPQATDFSGYGEMLPTSTPILTVDPNNSNRISESFNVSAGSGLSSTQASCDPNLFPPGTTIQVRDTNGVFIGPSHNGTYTTVAGAATAGNNLTLQLAGVQPTTGYVSILDTAPLVTSGAGPTAGASPPADPLPSTPNPGTGTRNSSTSPSRPAAIPANASGLNLSQRALREALKMADPPGVSHYVEGHAGWDGLWDCSGLVNWAFNQVGLTLPAYGPGVHGLTTWYQYKYFLSTGASLKPVSQAKSGDLLMPADQGHIAWCYTDNTNGNGMSYAACTPADGLRAYTIASEDPAFTICIDMSNFPAK